MRDSGDKPGYCFKNRKPSRIAGTQASFAPVGPLHPDACLSTRCFANPDMYESKLHYSARRLTVLDPTGGVKCKDASECPNPDDMCMFGSPGLRDTAFFFLSSRLLLFCIFGSFSFAKYVSFMLSHVAACALDLRQSCKSDSDCSRRRQKRSGSGSAVDDIGPCKVQCEGMYVY